MDGIKRINLIAGNNNVGKSTLLEAIYIYGNRSTDDYFDNIRIFRGMDNTNILEMLVTFFYMYDMQNKVTFKINDTDTFQIYKSEEKNISFNISYDKFTLGLIIKQLEKGQENYEEKYEIDGSALRKLINYTYTSYLGRGFYYTNNICEMLSISIANGNVTRDKIIELLKLLDSRISDFSIGPDSLGLGHDLKLKLDKDIFFPIRTLGDGINKLIQIILSLYSKPNSILLIDEIENGFYYSFYPKLWEMLGKVAKETNCQIFATTHSYECIEGATVLNENEPELFGFIRLDRDKNDNIIPKMYSGETFQYAMDYDWEVR
jgi:AAA15 family ATPase/GTPase